jgi:hypothetical protein
MKTNPDETPCNCYNNSCAQNPSTNAQVCESGLCSKFVCSDFGDGTSHQCGLPNDRSCQLGCKGPGWGSKGECVSTFDLPSKMPSGVSGGRLLKPGTPCMGYHGTCDATGKCQSADTADMNVVVQRFSKDWFLKNWKCVT